MKNISGEDAKSESFFVNPGSIGLEHYSSPSISDKDLLSLCKGRTARKGARGISVQSESEAEDRIDREEYLKMKTKKESKKRIETNVEKKEERIKKKKKKETQKIEKRKRKLEKKKNQ